MDSATLALILTWSWAISTTEALSLETDALAGVFRGLGWAQADFLVRGRIDRPILPVLFKALGNRAGMPLKFRTLTPEAWTDRTGQSYVPLVVIVKHLQELDYFEDMLREGHFVSENVMLLWDNELGYNGLEQSLRDMNLSRSFFYWGRDSSPEFAVRIQIFKERPILVRNDFHRDDATGLYVRNYDLHGAPFTMLSTPQWPWMYIEPCEDDPGIACNFSGSDVDIMRGLAFQFNFTLEVHVQQDGNYGTLPIIDDSGKKKYVGMLGAMVNDQHDRTSSSWIVTEERSKLVDFSFGYFNFRMSYLMDINRGTKLDWTLFMRPFTDSSWIACAVVSALVIAAYVLVSLAKSKGINGAVSMKGTLKTIAFSGWMCFTLVKMYYDGALTMFFTTKGKLPFDNLEKGLSLYPDFRLVIPKGFEGFLQLGAQGGSVEMRKQLERMEKNADQLAPEGWPAVIQQLARPGAFTQAYTQELKYYSDYLKAEDLDLRVIFQDPHVTSVSIMYPKRSPWRVVLDKGLRSLVSSGTMRRMLLFTGPDAGRAFETASTSDSATDVLDLSQVGLAFFLWAVCSIGAVVVLAAEVVRAAGTGGKGRFPRIREF